MQLFEFETTFIFSIGYDDMSCRNRQFYNCRTLNRREKKQREREKNCDFSENQKAYQLLFYLIFIFLYIYNREGISWNVISTVEHLPNKWPTTPKPQPPWRLMAVCFSIELFVWKNCFVFHPFLSVGSLLNWSVRCLSLGARNGFQVLPRAVRARSHNHTNPIHWNALALVADHYVNDEWASGLWRSAVGWCVYWLAGRPERWLTSYVRVQSPVADTKQTLILFDKSLNMRATILRTGPLN